MKVEFRSYEIDRWELIRQDYEWQTEQKWVPKNWMARKATRGKESQHLRLRIRTTWTWEENHQMQKIVAMCIIHT